MALKRTCSLILTCLLFCAPSSLFANQTANQPTNQVLSIKAPRILVRLSDPSTKVGQVFEVQNKKTSQVSLARVVSFREKTSGKEAILLLESPGILEEGAELNLTPKEIPNEPQTPKTKQHLVALGPALDSYTLKIKISENAKTSLADSSTGFQLRYENTLSPDWLLITNLASVKLEAAGTLDTASCMGSTTCTLEASYWSLDGGVAYQFLQFNSFSAWAGIGLGYWTASLSSSNVLDTSSINSLQTVLASLGARYRMGESSSLLLSMSGLSFLTNSDIQMQSSRAYLAWGQSF